MHVRVCQAVEMLVQEIDVVDRHFELSEIWVGKAANVGAQVSVPSVRGDRVLWMCGGHQSQVWSHSLVCGCGGSTNPISNGHVWSLCKRTYSSLCERTFLVPFANGHVRPFANGHFCQGGLLSRFERAFWSRGHLLPCFKRAFCLGDTRSLV